VQISKDYILKEIARTAEENKGIPLGKQKFTTETGIKENDWSGKYWSKWSDAVREAGYTPNKMQSAYDENRLIEQVISFIREIKRLPTIPEFRLKAHNTKGFPSHNTISGRLGRQSELASKIISYCRVHPEYSDILSFIVVPQTPDKESLPQRIEPDTVLGFVYLMKSGRFYKIGCSNHVGRRNYEIGIKLPEELAIVHKINTDDPTGIEAYWHNRFESKRKQGEWFDLSSSDVTAFKRRKFM
jgi:hypothetical protein